MWLYDSCIWVEWLLESRIGTSLKAEFLTIETSIVPTLVQFELQKWGARELGETETARLLALTTTCTVIPLDTAIAIEAATLAQMHNLHSADAIIYATAKLAGATLVTCDAHFATLPQVRYLKK